MHFTVGDFKQAKIAYKKVLSIANDYVDTLIGLANIANFEADNENMHQYLQLALATMPEHPIALYLWRVLLQKEGNMDSALITVKRALEIAPQHYVAWYELGNLLQKKQNFPVALTAFSTANQFHDRKLRYGKEKGRAQRLFEDTCAFIQTQIKKITQ